MTDDKALSYRQLVRAVREIDRIEARRPNRHGGWSIGVADAVALHRRLIDEYDLHTFPRHIDITVAEGIVTAVVRWGIVHLESGDGVSFCSAGSAPAELPDAASRAVGEALRWGLVTFLAARITPPERSGDEEE